MEKIEIDRWDIEDWAAHSRKGEVCGIFGCHSQPVERCEHCGNHYCEEHRWVIRGPGHWTDYPISWLNVKEV